MLWMFSTLILIFVVFGFGLILLISGFKRNLAIVKARVQGLGSKNVWVERWYRTGRRSLKLEKLEEVTLKLNDDNLVVSDVVHSDEETRLPLVVLVEGQPMSVDIRQQYSLDLSSKLINQAIKEAHWRGLQDSKDEVLKPKLPIVVILGAIILVVLVIISTYYAYQNNEILIEAMKQAEPFIEVGKQQIASVGGSIASIPK